ncbi:hypothetical protein GGX14DRAFT_699042 [Mycena pura]|uniref:Uncharacterized protein n=1 Tax=Mycena pura TaxID=153505 RepID=A0AAD6Y932_9AGAR|nr:hypothetical protein GGX14DRAFT_699042 [Mycena pura]
MRASRAFAAVVSLCLPLVAAQANRTVDDFSPLVTYTPASAVTHGNFTGFDQSKLYNGTVSVMDGDNLPHGVSMSMNFTGSALWVYLAEPQTLSGSYFNAYSVYIDGGVVFDEGASFGEMTDAEYSILAYSNTTLALGPHTFTLQAPIGLVYFDYAIFTSNNPTPETSAVSPAALSGGATSTGKAGLPTQPDGAPSESSQAAGALKNASNIARTAGAVTAVVLILVAGIVVLLLLRRRRARTRGVQRLYDIDGKESGEEVYGAPGRGGARLSDLSTAQMSEATVLHAPWAAASQQSPHRTASVPPQMPVMSRNINSLSSASSSHAHSEQAVQYDAATNTLAYIPAADQEPQLQRVLAEQRAVEAECARPDPAQWWGDEKARLAAGTSAPARARVMNSSSPGSVGRSWSTRISSSAAPSTGTVYSASSSSIEAPPQDTAALSTFAAEMALLRAQVARLEGKLEDEGVPPPAYD